MMWPPQRVKMTSIPSDLRALATRWPPEMSSGSCAENLASLTSATVSLIAMSSLLSWFSGAPAGQVVQVLGYVPGQVQRVLAHEALCELGVASLERLDDVQVVFDRPLVALVLPDGPTAQGLHVDEQVAGHLHQQAGSGQLEDPLVELEIGV